MKTCTFLLCLCFFCTYDQLQAQTWLPEKPLFDSLFQAGRYQAALVPGMKLFSDIDNWPAYDSTGMKILKRLAFTFRLTGQLEMQEQAVHRFLSLAAPNSADRADILVLYGALQTDRGRL